MPKAQYPLHIKQMLVTLTPSPGVYQMFNEKNQIIYIGKAINLKKRVSSYFQKTPDTEKLASLVSHIDHIKVIVTQNENEAYLLENQLIKQYQPRYNILLRDDKSYPYIVISKHASPRLSFQRGWSKGEKNTAVFGPYPSSIAVRETVKFIQKLFKLRTCDDSFFRHRTRPCLLYQIKQCSAPCVKYISSTEYLEEVKWAKLLLQGKNQEVIQNIVQRMQTASTHQEYELAARLRDQITYLRHIQAKQIAVNPGKNNCDVFYATQKENINIVEVITVREGCITSNYTYYPKSVLYHPVSEILSAFISQYYLGQGIDKPKEILLSQMCEDKEAIEQNLGCKIIVPKKGEKLQYIALAEKTARESLKTKLLTQNNDEKVKELKTLLNIDEQKLVLRVACFDISHHAGESAVASCVVWNGDGFEKQFYRKINITGITPGDDYAAMSHALDKYFRSERCIQPDILLIDGGRGQLNIAHKTLASLGINNIHILAIAKGEGRKAGLEKIYCFREEMRLLPIDTHSPAFYLLQQIRDEAHRFAISAHRNKQSHKRKTSILENIPGIGPKKRQQLLQYLGGLQELKHANIEQLSQVPGINHSLAEKIYQFFHGKE